MIPAVANSDRATGLAAAAAPRSGWQYRTSSLLWLTFTAAMTLAYARLFGDRALLVMIMTPAVALPIGAGIGSFTRRTADSIYWSIVGALLGAACVVAAPVDELTTCFWPLLGAVAGGYTAASQSKVTFITLLKAAVAGAVLVALFQSPFPMGADEFLVDLALAPAVAVGLAVLIQIVEWLRAKYHSSRDAWAAGLIFAVIAGNLWAAFVAGRLGQ